LCVALLGLWAAAPGAPAATAFELKDSSYQQFLRAKVYGWYVKVSDDSGSLSLSANSHKALLYHNALSVYSHAKGIEPVSLRYVKDKLANNHVGLVATQSMSITQAQEKARRLGISPQSERVVFEPSVVPYYYVDSFSPNDQCYSYQSFLSSNSRFLDSIEADYLWPSDTRGEGAPAAIAFLDTGIVSHNDFGTNRRIIGWDYISNPNQADDGDARDDNPEDPGFTNKCSSSSGYHGTHVASLAAARGNNGIGVTGVSWHSPIVALRVIGVEDGSPGDILAALHALPEYSRQVGIYHEGGKIRAANMSLGISSNLKCDSAFVDEDFATSLLENDILVIAAAGNSHADANDYAPANCADVLSVLATNHQGGKAHYSNYGPEIDLAAPGGEFDSNGNNSYGLLGMVNSNRYDYKQGTSMAAPLVSGVAAQLAYHNTNLSAREIRNIMLATAQEYLGNNAFGLKCDTSLCGAGLVNGKHALEHLKSGLRFLFFPRQIMYLPKDVKHTLDVHMTRSIDNDIRFRLLVNSSSCQLATTSYPVFTIPAGELSGVFYDSDRLELDDEGCNDVTYTISLNDENGDPLNSDTTNVLLVKDYNGNEGRPVSGGATNPDANYNQNTRHTYRVIRKNQQNFNPQLDLDEAAWEYLPPSTYEGNTHNIYLSEPGTFHVSTVSDMDSEIKISKLGGDVLYNSQTADSSNSMRADIFVKFSIDRAQSLLINIKERFPSTGSGGMYALVVTQTPTFNRWDGFTNLQCPVDLGVDEGACSATTLDESVNNGGGSNRKSNRGSSLMQPLTLFALLAIALLALYIRRSKSRR